MALTVERRAIPRDVASSRAPIARPERLRIMKASVTVGRVLAAHGHRPDRRGACPIHGGDNPTAFTHDEKRWTCWTRCGSGDVVRLVELLQGVGFRDALAWLEHFTGLRADEPEAARDEFPDIGPAARRAWLASIDERWNNLRRFDPSSPWMAALEDEGREARRMPGAMTHKEIVRLMHNIARVLDEERR